MKKILSFVIVLTILIVSFSGCGKNSSGNTESGNSTAVNEYKYTFRELPKPKYITPAEDFAGGSGTEADPYQISNAAELALLNKNLLNEETGFDSGYYVLTADISLNDVSDFESWQNTAPEYSWQPMGFGSTITGFKGVFNGNGHTISGIYINTNCESGGENYGLFSFLNGTVKNLNIDKSYFEISGKDGNVGSIAGSIGTEAIIENCTSAALFKCYDTVCGGIAGNTSGGMAIPMKKEEIPEAKYSKIIGCTFCGEIEQMKENAMQYLGGIAGKSESDIDSCVNEGTISFNGDNVSSAGGIAGIVFDGSIQNCKNSGKLLCQVGIDYNNAVTGGIAGKVLLDSTGSADYMSRGITVNNCENTGVAEGMLYAGGIIGQAFNDNNDYCLSITNCTNIGTVSAKLIGGIIGDLVCHGDKEKTESIVVENCKNEANLTDGTAGGIIGQLMSQTGDMQIKNCVNSGNLSTSAQHCSGIVAYWIMEGYPDESIITIEGCKNSGNISSDIYAGGIISFMDMPACVKMGKNIQISLLNCSNSGNVTVASINGYVGGILGNFGMKDISTVIDNCSNSGTISITTAADSVTDEDAQKMTLSRIAGGIIGRVGEGLLLSTDYDEAKTKNIQAENGVLKITNCSNTGKPDIVNPNAENVKNWFGGIIGNTSAENGYSFNVANCTYMNFDRGLGNDDVADVGEKAVS